MFGLFSGYLKYYTLEIIFFTNLISMHLLWTHCHWINVRAKWSCTQMHAISHVDGFVTVHMCGAFFMEWPLRLQASCRWRSKQPNKATMRQNSYEVRTCSCSAPFVGFLFPPFADFRGSCLHIQTQSLCWFSTFLALWGGLPWKMQYLNISIIKFWFFSVLVVCYSEMNALLRVVVLSERDRHSDNVKFNKRVTEMKVCHLS